MIGGCSKHSRAARYGSTAALRMSWTPRATDLSHSGPVASGGVVRGSCRRPIGPHPENALCCLVLSHHHGFHVDAAQRTAGCSAPASSAVCTASTPALPHQLLGGEGEELATAVFVSLNDLALLDLLAVPYCKISVRMRLPAGPCEVLGNDWARPVLDIGAPLHLLVEPLERVGAV